MDEKVVKAKVIRVELRTVNPLDDPPKNNIIKCSALPTKLKALSLEIVGKPLFG